MITCCWKVVLTNQDWTKASLTTKCLAEAYLEPCQISKMERLMELKVVICKMFDLRRLAGFWVSQQRGEKRDVWIKTIDRPVLHKAIHACFNHFTHPRAANNGRWPVITDHFYLLPTINLCICWWLCLILFANNV